MKNHTFERAAQIWSGKEAEYEAMLRQAQSLYQMEQADAFLYRARHQWQLAVKRAFRHGTATLSPDQFEAQWRIDHGLASYAKQEERAKQRAERMAAIHEKRRVLEVESKFLEGTGPL